MKQYRKMVVSIGLAAFVALSAEGTETSAIAQTIMPNDDAFAVPTRGGLSVERSADEAVLWLPIDQDLRKIATFYIVPVTGEARASLHSFGWMEHTAEGTYLINAGAVYLVCKGRIANPTEASILCREVANTIADRGSCPDMTGRWRECGRLAGGTVRVKEFRSEVLRRVRACDATSPVVDFYFEKGPADVNWAPGWIR